MNLPLDELERRLETTLEGLSQEEAGKRLAQYGPNALVCIPMEEGGGKP